MRGQSEAERYPFGPIIERETDESEGRIKKVKS